MTRRSDLLHRTYLIRPGSLLCKSHDRRHADGQVVSTDKVSAAVLNHVPVGLQVLNFVAVRSCKVGAHAPVVSCDNDTTSSCGLLLIHVVSNLKACFLVCSLEDLGVLVLADGAKEDDRVWLKNVLVQCKQLD